MTCCRERVEACTGPRQRKCPWPNPPRRREHVVAAVAAAMMLIAYGYLGLGERDHCFEALELAYEQGDTRLIDIRPRWANIDSSWTRDPRFASLLKKMGLPPLI